MRICYVASARSYYHPKWFEYFVNHGHQVCLISPDAPRATFPGVRIYCFPQFKLKILRLAFTFLFGGIFIRRIIRKEKPDILHAIELDEGFAAAASGFHPFVMTPNGSDLLVWAKKHLLVRIAARYVFSKANAVVSDSELLKQTSLKLGARTTGNEIIQWGVDLKQFHNRLDKRKIRNIINLGNGPLLLSTRALTGIYNIDTIIRCLPEILKQVPSARLILVYGFNDNEMAMKKLAADLGVADETIFVGAVNYEKMPDYFAAADVCLSVPSSDSSPRAVYEAMACKVPPVLSDLPWTKDFMVPEQNALLVPVRDHHALALAILRLLSDEKLRERIIEANLKLVSEKLDYQKHMSRMESIYQSLCRTSPRS
ncbi:MAG: glycosyltransferase [Chloroflexi bacterium]|nr:glycosyltransferase [Chloroflexota bacterium]